MADSDMADINSENINYNTADYAADPPSILTVVNFLPSLSSVGASEPASASAGVHDLNPAGSANTSAKNLKKNPQEKQKNLVESMLATLAPFLSAFMSEEAVCEGEIALLLPQGTGQDFAGEGFASELTANFAGQSGLVIHTYTVAPSQEHFAQVSPAENGAAQNKPAQKSGQPNQLKMSDVFRTLQAILSEHSQFNAVFHFWGDAPHMNSAANGEIIDLHRRYLCDYVFAEGYPEGITGSLLTGAILPLLQTDGAQIPLQRKGVFETVRVNINSYDIETALAPRDQRMLRLELFTDRRRNALICESLPLSASTSTEEVCAIIEEHRRQYRTLPAFFALQLSGRCPQSCSYCPFPQFAPDHLHSTQFMPSANFATVLRKICGFVEDPSISLSLWGELSLHPELEALLNLAKSQAQAQSAARFYIETSGVGWSPAMRELLTSFPPEQLSIILSLDSINPELYRRLRGEGFEEAMDFAHWASTAIPEQLYVQAVRMNENEEHLLEFYKHWKKQGIHFIIQKYNDHSGYLSQRRVADLSPLKRHECWHIKRDMVVDIQGRVFACPNHSISGKLELSYGNLFTDDIDKVWSQGEELFASDLNNSPPDICSRCDEWYTFNF